MFMVSHEALYTPHTCRKVFQHVSIHGFLVCYTKTRYVLHFWASTFFVRYNRGASKDNIYTLDVSSDVAAWTGLNTSGTVPSAWYHGLFEDMCWLLLRRNKVCVGNTMVPRACPARYSKTSRWCVSTD